MTRNLCRRTVKIKDSDATICVCSKRRGSMPDAIRDWIPTIRPRVLIVDDDETIRTSLSLILEYGDFEVVTAASVNDALKLIGSQVFDVLLSDLHMPGAGDGLTVVSAMRHANPQAVTILLSAFPEMDAAAHAILMQADEILVKPMQVTALVEAIKLRLTVGAPGRRVVESVATILERSADTTIMEWFERV